MAAIRKKQDLRGAAAKLFTQGEEKNQDIGPETTDADSGNVRELPLTTNGGVVKLEGGLYKIPAISEIRETKSKRVQLVFQASLLRRVKEEAEREGTSVNELVHIALREYLANKEV